MMIIQKFVILAALMAGLGLASAVETIAPIDVDPSVASGCCTSCIMQSMGTEYCDRCFQANGGC